MKLISLTSTLIAVLLLTATSAAGETASDLRALISQKESELSRVQGELATLKKKLSSASAKTTDTDTYKVEAGDTMSSIARRHKMSYSQLVKLNKLTDPSKIRIGQELVVRGGASTTVSAKQKTTAHAPSAPQSDKHTVKRGETFYAIARSHQLSVGKLKELNPGVDTNRIIVGQPLKVSGSPAARIASNKKTGAPQTRRSFSASAPQKSSTTALTRSATTNKPTSKPKSSRKVSEPKKAPVNKEVASAPAPPKKEEAPMPAAPKRVSSVIVTSETSFADFAKKHGTSTTSLNALNGWNLPKATVLARGSEIYVPK